MFLRTCFQFIVFKLYGERAMIIFPEARGIIYPPLKTKNNKFALNSINGYHEFNSRAIIFNSNIM